MTRGFLRFLRGNVIGLLALFIALGGTTYAATALPKNSVGAKQLKKNAVTAVKIKSGAVTNGKIGANAVTGAKVKDDSLTGADILESSLGKVPSATAADSATNATNATNATKVNGRTVGCPTGTVESQHFCFETTNRAAVGDVFAASDACAAAGRFLPTVLQLRAARNATGMSLGGTTQWTSSTYYDGAFHTFLLNNSTGLVDSSTVAGPYTYRCVANLIQ